MAFFLRFERNGKDLYPEVQRVISEGRVPDNNRVRYYSNGSDTSSPPLASTSPNTFRGTSSEAGKTWSNDSRFPSTSICVVASL